MEAAEPPQPHVGAADVRVLRPDGGRLHAGALPGLHPAGGARALLGDALPDRRVAVELPRKRRVRGMWASSSEMRSPAFFGGVVFTTPNSEKETNLLFLRNFFSFLGRALTHHVTCTLAWSLVMATVMSTLEAK